MIEGLIYISEGARNYYHMKEDEIFYVLNGTLQFYVAGEQFCAPAGTTVYIPRNVSQSVRNMDLEPVYMQILFIPSGRENYSDRVSVICDTQPINYTEATTLALKYGVVTQPEVDWKDLHCWSNSGNLFTLSSYITFIIVLFYVLTSVY